jgi:hypothetical protein
MRQTLLRINILEDAQPVGPCDDRNNHQQENDQQDEAAAESGAGAAPPEPEPALQPFEQSIQEEKLQQTSQTTLTISHTTSINEYCVTVEFNMKEGRGQHLRYEYQWNRTPSKY